jgi:hypothetical protein
LHYEQPRGGENDQLPAPNSTTKGPVERDQRYTEPGSRLLQERAREQLSQKLFETNQRKTVPQTDNRQTDEEQQDQQPEILVEGTCTVQNTYTVGSKHSPQQPTSYTTSGDKTIHKLVSKKLSEVLVALVSILATETLTSSPKWTANL